MVLLRRETLSTVDHGWMTHGDLGPIWPWWTKEKAAQTFVAFFEWRELNRAVLGILGRVFQCFGPNSYKVFPISISCFFLFFGKAE
jgi:hypothetical protein